MFCLKWSTGTGGKRGQRVQQASVDLDARHSRMTQSLQFGHFRNTRIHHWINPIEFQLEMTYYYLSLLQVFSYIRLYHTNTRAGQTAWCFLNRFWTKRSSFSINKMDYVFIKCGITKGSYSIAESYCSYTLHFYSMRSIYLTSWLMIPLVIWELQMSRTKFNM